MTPAVQGETHSHVSQRKERRKGRQRVLECSLLLQGEETGAQMGAGVSEEERESNGSEKATRRGYDL